MILGNSLASHDREARDRMRECISKLMTDTTKISIERKVASPEKYDMFIDIVDGRIDGSTRQKGLQDKDARQDLNRKISAIAKTALFAKLDFHQQRLLAFDSQWYKAEAGRTIFKVEEKADAAYLCVEGSAGLYWPAANGETRLVSEIIPGRLIGDLSIILRERRSLNLVTTEDCLFLRIGATELMEVIENDALAASSLMRSVADNLSGAVDSLRTMRMYATERGVDFSEFDKTRIE